MSIQAKLLHLQSIQNLLAPYRYLYCVDLEATCDEVGESESPRQLAVAPAQMETIEIGLVVIDLEALEIVDEFQRFVRPQINPILTRFLQAAHIHSTSGCGQRRNLCGGWQGARSVSGAIPKRCLGILGGL